MATDFKQDPKYRKLTKSQRVLADAVYRYKELLSTVEAEDKISEVMRRIGLDAENVGTAILAFAQQFIECGGAMDTNPLEIYGMGMAEGVMLGALYMQALDGKLV